MIELNIVSADSDLLRELAHVMSSLNAHGELVSIIKKIVEECSDPKGKDYIYYDVEYGSDDPTPYIEDRLKTMGYVVETSNHKEDGYAALTVRW